MSTNIACAVACAACDLSDICRLRAEHERGHVRGQQRNRHAEPMRALTAGAYLFRAGSRAQGIYAVRYGTLKTVALAADGEEQVLSFHVPGDVIGLEAMALGTHRYDVVALNAASCCVVPIARFSEQYARVPSLATAVVNLLSQAVAQQSARLDIARGSARRRVLGLLLDLGARMEQRGFDGQHLQLAMFRRDIASFLDTRIETVSRILRRLHSEGVIRLHGRHITLLQANVALG